MSFINTFQKSELGMAICLTYGLESDSDFFKILLAVDEPTRRLIQGSWYEWLVHNAPRQPIKALVYYASHCPDYLHGWSFDQIGVSPSRVEYLRELGLCCLGDLANVCKNGTLVHLVADHPKIQRQLVQRLSWLCRMFFVGRSDSLGYAGLKERKGAYCPILPPISIGSDGAVALSVLGLLRNKVSQIKEHGYRGVACYLQVRSAQETHRKSVCLLQSTTRNLKDALSDMESIGLSLIASESGYWDRLREIFQASAPSDGATIDYQMLMRQHPQIFPSIESKVDWFRLNFMLRFVSPEWTLVLLNKRYFIVPRSISEIESLKADIKNAMIESPQFGESQFEDMVRPSGLTGPFIESLRSVLTLRRSKYTQNALLASRLREIEKVDSSKVFEWIEANQDPNSPLDLKESLHIVLQSATAPLTLKEICSAMNYFFDMQVPGPTISVALLSFCNVLSDGKYGLRKHLDLSDRSVVLVCQQISRWLRLTEQGAFFSNELPTGNDAFQCPETGTVLDSYRIDAILRAAKELEEYGMLPFSLTWIRPMVWHIAMPEPSAYSETHSAVEKESGEVGS